MQKILMILEVSRKQDYIFGSKRLKENAERSEEINYVTGSKFFKSAAGELYEKRNLVYTGGGHSVLQFENRNTAIEFAGKVTERAIREFIGLEIFVKIMDYDELKTPGENLKQLSKELEEKKSKRKEAFRWNSLGIEKLDIESYTPMLIEQEQEMKKSTSVRGILPPTGWEFPMQFEDLEFKAGTVSQRVKDNFIAVIHIDGNSMGSRVDNIYQKEKNNWEKCCESLRNFSEGIQKDFEDSFQEMTNDVIDQGIQPPLLPMRPVILAGDDVCFVTAGCIGLECARIFMEKLSKKKNKEDGIYYSACAGVALVHKKYPFHMAYNLAEELCSNAKKFGAGMDENSRISAIDWHIEFGQLKDNITEIRKDYLTEDGNRLELRPLAVVVPNECSIDTIHEYDFFKTMCQAIQEKREKIARSKIKEWRTALKQGEIETQYFLHDKQIEDILYHGFTAEYRSEEQKAEQYDLILNEGREMVKRAFREFNGEKHCIFFDSIEMMDHAVFFREVES